MLVEQKNNMQKIISRAPARTCLFGDHQDYLGLPVIACAINRHITLDAVRNGLEKFVIHMPDMGEVRTISIDPSIDRVEKGDHLLAALKILEDYGCIPTTGYDITIRGNIAINAGTSSSSAVVVSWIQFLIEAFGCNQIVDKEFISQLAYHSEVSFHGAPGGKMDQYSIAIGHIIFLETGENTTYEVFDKPLKGLIVAESGIPKQTAGVLAELKEKALLAIHIVKQQIPEFNISEVTKKELPKYLNYISDDLKTYLRATVLNHDITQRALQEFRKSRLRPMEIGKLMNEHHQVLKEYLKLTVPRIDDMITGAIQAGALGAKIVGSGRGGSIVVLAPKGKEETVIKALMDAGAKDAYKVNVDPGARIEIIK